MIKTVLALTLALSAFSVLAQTEERPSRVSLNVGFAAPIGSFRQPDFEDEYPVFAQSGTQLTFSYIKDLYRNLAIGATLGWRRNPFDFDAFYIRDDAYSGNGKATAWHTLFAMADAYAQVPVQDAILYAKGSVGAALTRTASYSVPTDFGTIYQNAVNGSSLAWGLGIGVRQEFGHFGFNVAADLLFTKPRFEVDGKGRNTAYKQQLNSFGTSIGFSYTL